MSKFRESFERACKAASDAHAHAKAARAAFEDARETAAEVIESKGADAPEVKAAEDAHAVYETACSELARLEGERDRLLKLMGDAGERKTAPGSDVELKARGAWLHNELRTKTMNSSGGIGAAVSPVAYPEALFDRLAPAAVMFAAGVTVIRTDRGEVSIPHLLSDGVASWTAEGGQITASDPGGESIVARPKKLAALTVVNSEVANDSTPEALAVAEQALVRSLALGLDLGMIEGSGAGTAIRGIKNVSGIGVVDVAANGAAPSDLDVFAQAIGSLEMANAAATGVICHPRTWRDLMKVREQSGSNKPLVDLAGGGTESPRRSIFGVPVFLTTQTSVAETQGTSSDCSSAYVIDASQIVAVVRQDAEVAVDPFYGFDTDQVGVRAILRADLVVPNAAAVTRIRGFRPAA